MKIRIAILVAATLISAQATAQNTIPPGAPGFNAALDREFALMNSQAPIEMNDANKMIHVSRNGAALLYEIETAIPRDKWTQEMREQVARETTINVCTDKESRNLLDASFQVRWLFTDQSKLFVTSFVITKDKCAAL
jgi:hypothetical protein